MDVDARDISRALLVLVFGRGVERVKRGRREYH